MLVWRNFDVYQKFNFSIFVGNFKSLSEFSVDSFTITFEFSIFMPLNWIPPITYSPRHSAVDVIAGDGNFCKEHRYVVLL